MTSPGEQKRESRTLLDFLTNATDEEWLQIIDEANEMQRETLNKQKDCLSKEPSS